MKNKLLLVLLILGVAQASAEDQFMEFGAKNFQSKKLEKSKWLMEFGYNYLPWDMKLPAFEGTFDAISAEEEVSLSGVNLGLGGQIYFGGGFSTTIRISAAAYNSFEETDGKAADDIDLDLLEIDLNHKVFTGEASASIDYLVENSIINFQPFVEFAVGAGESTIEREYKYEGGVGLPSPNPESYDVKSDEKFNFSRIGLGLNFISSKGLISYIKVSQMTRTTTERKVSGSTLDQSTATNSFNSNEEDLQEESVVTVGSLGIGYMF